MPSRAKTRKQKPLACACVDTYNISVFFRLNESSWNPSSWNGRHPSDGLLTFFVVLDFCHMPQSLSADIILVWPDQPAWLSFSLFSRLVSRCWLLCYGVRLMSGRKATTNRNKYENIFDASRYKTSTSLVQGHREVRKKATRYVHLSISTPTNMYVLRKKYEVKEHWGIKEISVCFLFVRTFRNE